MSQDGMDKGMAEHALSELVAAHAAFLYRFAYRLSGSESDAEDLVQQTFLAAHEKQDQLREPARARAWLVAILRNAYRKSGRRQRPVPFAMCQNDPEPVEESEIERLVDEESVRRALAELPEEYRAAIILFYFDELSYKEIADLLEIPIGTVMSRLSRGKAHLRSRLVPDFAPSRIAEG